VLVREFFNTIPISPPKPIVHLRTYRGLYIASAPILRHCGVPEQTAARLVTGRVGADWLAQGIGLGPLLALSGPTSPPL
jgi:hypothetical protein